MSPVRTWITNYLKSNISAGEIFWSDKDGLKFSLLTGASHAYLMNVWFDTPFDTKQVDYTKTGSDPTFTTCTGFAAVLNTTIRSEGGLTPKVLPPFKLQTQRGWVAGAGCNPEAGDFVLFGAVLFSPRHVACIAEKKGESYSLVAGGRSGRASKHDGVARTHLEAMPSDILGKLDVDVYYEGWRTAEEQVYG